MNLDLELIAKIVSPILTLLVGTLIRNYNERRPKLVSFIGHISSFDLKDEKHTKVGTHSIVIRNAGRKSATNVRVGHHFLPAYIKIDPSIKYTIEENPENKSEIVFPVLVPKEQVSISYLYTQPVTFHNINSYTKSDDGFAEILRVIPKPQPNKLIEFILSTFVFVGGSFTLYWIFKLITYLLNIS